MASITTRSSVLGVKVETTEGTPVAPAATTDFIAMQDDFTMSPEFEVLENAEMKSSIGRSKSILGSENPTCSFSHYLRHSGVEGQEPNYGQLLKAAFGASDTEATEYNTVASSTTSVIKVDAGEGAQFRRGQALLIKDGTNGYRIRPVHSISTDDLTIGFNVPTAPGTGVNLGKATTYYPANTGHQSLSLWHYLGNSGAVQLMAGAKVTEVSITAEAGQLVNASYSLEGVGFYFNPIEITSSTRYIDWTDDDGTFAASVAVKWYKDPHELAAALTSAMNDTATTETHSVTYSDSTGKFTFTSTGTVLSLLWNTGANTANTIGTKLGFSVAADDTGTAAATGYTSDNALTLAASYTPAYDSSDPLAAKNQEVMIGDASDYSCFAASSVVFTLSDTRATIPSICAESGVSGSIINERQVTVSVTALLDQYDADKFNRFRENTETRFQYSFGTKTGGNWVAGKCGCIYLPTATITSFNIEDQDGLAALSMELTAFVNSSGEGEAFVSFV